MQSYNATINFTFTVDVTGKAESMPDFIRQINALRMQGQIVMPLDLDDTIEVNYNPTEPGIINHLKIAGQ